MAYTYYLDLVLNCTFLSLGSISSKKIRTSKMILHLLLLNRGKIRPQFIYIIFIRCFGHSNIFLSPTLYSTPNTPKLIISHYFRMQSIICSACAKISCILSFKLHELFDIEFCLRLSTNPLSGSFSLFFFLFLVLLFSLSFSLFVFLYD